MNISILLRIHNQHSLSFRFSKQRQWAWQTQWTGCSDLRGSLAESHTFKLAYCWLLWSVTMATTGMPKCNKMFLHLSSGIVLQHVQVFIFWTLSSVSTDDNERTIRGIKVMFVVNDKLHWQRLHQLFLHSTSALTLPSEQQCLTLIRLPLPLSFISIRALNLLISIRSWIIRQQNPAEKKGI